MSNNYCVIMAGGAGSRFWPKSREDMPKQFLDILGSGKSFIRQTFERFLPIIDVENFLVVTNERYRNLVLEHIPELKPEQVLCEPMGRNTAPCISYAAHTLLKSNPEARMIVTPADHFVSEEPKLLEIVEECLEFASKQRALMTIGVRPTRPETGYGYIQVSSNDSISKVKCFTEKPILEMAQTFLQCGEFFWNSGIFVWRADDIIEAIGQHLPEQAHLFNSIIDKLGTAEEGSSLSTVYSECKSISIDYGVMERAENVYVRVGEFGWSDVGTWSSVYQLSRKDKYANMANPDTFLYDSRSNVVSIPKGKLAVISGLKEFIIVDTDDVLMICPRSEEMNIKKFADEIKFLKGDDNKGVI